MFAILQLVGGLILCLGYIPQIRQIVETRSTLDINLTFVYLTVLGVLLMEIYAISLVVMSHVGWAFLITNTLSLILSLLFANLTYKYRK